MYPHIDLQNSFSVVAVFFGGKKDEIYLIPQILIVSKKLIRNVLEIILIPTFSLIYHYFKYLNRKKNC